ncbi:hypothetical protein D3C78_1647860 [compost metagenome]
MLAYALVVALIMPANKDEMLFTRKLLSLLLGELLTLRTHKYDPRLHMLIQLQILYSGKYRLGLEHHPPAAPVWIIINCIMLIRGIFAEIDRFQ